MSQIVTSIDRHVHIKTDRLSSADTLKRHSVTKDASYVHKHIEATQFVQCGPDEVFGAFVVGNAVEVGDSGSSRGTVLVGDPRSREVVRETSIDGDAQIVDNYRRPSEASIRATLHQSLSSAGHDTNAAVKSLHCLVSFLGRPLGRVSTSTAGTLLLL